MFITVKLVIMGPWNILTIQTAQIREYCVAIKILLPSLEKCPLSTVLLICVAVCTCVYTCVAMCVRVPTYIAVYVYPRVNSSSPWVVGLQDIFTFLHLKYFCVLFFSIQPCFKKRPQYVSR